MKSKQVINRLQDEIYAFGDVKMLANRVGLSPACIYSLRAGRTKWPRGNTMDTLMEAFHLEFQLVRTQ